MGDPGVRPQAGPSALPAELLERLHDLAPDADAALLDDFAEAVLRRVPSAQLDAGDDAGLAEVAARAFGVVRERRPRERKILVADADLPGGEAGSVLVASTADRPFLLSSVAAEVADRGIEIVRTIHPIIAPVRDEAGRLVGLRAVRDATERESIIHLELRPRLDAEESRALEEGVRRVVEDVAAATDDYVPMRSRILEAIETVRPAPKPPDDLASAMPEADPEEVTAFLAWLAENNFLLIGARDYTLTDEDGTTLVQAVDGSELGVLKGAVSTYAEPTPLDRADEGVRARITSPALISVARSHRASRVDQRVRMLNVWIRRLDETGGVVGERRLLGIFTRRAQAERATSVPVLRRKFARLVEHEDILPDTHDERTYTALFEAMPKEELFELDVDQLRDAIGELAAAEEERDVRVLCHVDEVTHTASVIVSVPRDRYEPELRRRIQSLLLERFGGESVDVDLSLGDRPDAVVRFAVHVPDGPIGTPPTEELEAIIRRLARTWRDDLETALVGAHGRSEGDRLARAVGDRLPPAYRETTSIADAVADIDVIGALVATDEEMRVVVREAERSPRTRVKIFKRGEGVELSTMMPILESLGLTVVEELPFRLLGGDPELHVHDYGVRVDGATIDAETDGARIADAISAAWDGRLEVDSLNRLVVRAGLDWSTTAILRAYRRLRRQLGTVHTADYHNDALAGNPRAVRSLVELFAARFDPERDASPEQTTEASEAALAAIDEIVRLDDDRILRDVHGLITATLRTNHYAEAGSGALALKLQCDLLPQAPRPLPHREIFVYSPAVEGIHLRGGPVARGGIRWSDRRDDFRTEVLDLVQTQVLKNALIVPDGAKGAFVVKRPETDPVRAYATFVRALLEVTDNVVGGEVVGPPGVRRLDGDDPYLVVAADRGTATFSDLANTISEEHDFWLGDAFASGGSDGYDHKLLGITARGAWVAVERHLRELGIDVDTDEVTVAGIGDMSGDVFGNGMLRSSTLRLVAAFDHRDIFLDPSPDPVRAFEERRRLFRLERSSWQDYDRDALGPGGGIWSRSEKSITVSEEIADLLRLDERTMSAPELIRAILRAPVDLLFAGGIGTFVKSTSESDEAAGDRANTEVRVNATDLRCRVVGEGANLGLTQKARVQYARRGGRLNADFVDNAAGVDISDREVNLKILLRAAIENGAIGADERNDLLRAVTDDVVAACLADVDRHTWTLFVEAQRSPGSMELYESLMARLERDGALDRQVESLPTTEEMRERAEASAGLTRPELAVVLAATKSDLARTLVDSALVEDPVVRPLLHDYFPPKLADRCAAVVDEHRLRRELVATRLANEVVDRTGVTFVHQLSRELGVTPVEVVAAYWIARGVGRTARFEETVAEIERTLGPETALVAREQVHSLVESLVREYVRSGDLGRPGDTIAADSPAFAEVEELFGGGVRPGQETARQAERLADAGVDAATAVRLARLRELAVAPHVAQVARMTGRPPAGVASSFARLDGALGIGRIRRLVDAVRPSDRWERWHVAGLVDDLRVIHRRAVEAALADEPELSEVEAVDRYLGRRDPAIRRANHLLRQVEEEVDGRSLEAIAVAVRSARVAVDGG